MIDLHAHSTFSDGTLTPAELAARAAGLGLTALALTDHDSTDGVPPLRAACAALPAERRPAAIAGVEISAEVARGTMHVLGYFMDIAHPPLQEALVRIRAGRAARNAQILERLAKLGCPLEAAAVAAEAGEDVIGRPHIAAAMIKRGYVKDKLQAFERFLAKGKPAYVERFRLAPPAALAAIRAAGGVPVLAHPVSLGLSWRALRAAVAELKVLGLEGLEVYYPLHSPEQTGKFALLARELDLVATGGSDFHGDGKPGLELGRGFGGLAVPDETVNRLRERAGGEGRGT